MRFEDRRWTPNWVIPWGDIKPIAQPLVDEYAERYPHPSGQVQCAFQRIFTGCWWWWQDPWGWISQTLDRNNFDTKLGHYDRAVISCVLKFLKSKGVIEIQPGVVGKCTGYRPMDGELMNKLKVIKLDPQTLHHGVIKDDKDKPYFEFTSGRGEKRLFDRRVDTVKNNEKLNAKGWSLPSWALHLYIKMHEEYLAKRMDLEGVEIDEDRARSSLLAVLRALPVVDGLIDVSFLAGQHATFKETTWRGGRISNGFQLLPRELRRCLLRDGQPIVELDYSAFNPTVLYTLCGLRPPEKPYNIGGLTRDEAKQAMNIMISCSSRRKALGSIRKNCLADRPSRLANAIEDAHSNIKHRFYEADWDVLQNIESMAAEKILASFNMMGIPGISIFDSFVVAQEHEDLLLTVMKDALVDAMAFFVFKRKKLIKKEYSTSTYKIREVPIPEISESYGHFRARFGGATFSSIKIKKIEAITTKSELRVALATRFEDKLSEAQRSLERLPKKGVEYIDTKQASQLGLTTEAKRSKYLGPPTAWMPYKFEMESGHEVEGEKAVWEQGKLDQFVYGVDEQEIPKLIASAEKYEARHAKAQEEREMKQQEYRQEQANLDEMVVLARSGSG